MAYEAQLQNIPGATAGADLSADQYKFVRDSAAGFIRNNTNGYLADGVLQDKPDAAGKACEVAYAGVTKIKSGGVFAKGDKLMANAIGKAIVATSVASAAEKSSALTGPYVLAAADTLVIDTDNGGNETVTFDAAAGYDIDTTSYPCADQTGLTLKLKVDGGSEQTITFGTCTTAAHVIAQVNAQLIGGAAELSTANVKIKSDRKGTSSSIEITGGTCALTWAAATAGTGDVAFIDDVTATEVKTRIEADSIAEVTVVGSTFIIKSPTTGALSELDFKSGAALAKLGLAVEVIQGQASNSAIRGTAREAATASDQIVSMLLAPTGKF